MSMPPPGFNDRVWDMPVRVTHWVLAATALGAYFVPAVPLNAHAFLGYAALTAVAIRIAWGFVGSEYARFTNFVPGMRALIAYLHALARRLWPICRRAAIVAGGTRPSTCTVIAAPGL